MGHDVSHDTFLCVICVLRPGLCFSKLSLGIHEFARHTGCSSSAFLYLSQDVGKHGSLRAPCGPNNFGVFILRNGARARAMLEHVTAQSQRPGRFWQACACTARSHTCHICVCRRADCNPT